MTSRQKTYQKQSPTSDRGKSRKSPAKQAPQIQNKYQFADLPQGSMMDNISPSVKTSEAIIQPKLQIGEVGDQYEQEADRTAKQVVDRIHTPEVQAMSADDTQPILQAKPISSMSPVSRPKLSLQAKGRGGGEASQDLEDNINRAKSGGQSLAPPLQAKMGEAMGADFSGVKIHSDRQADSLNQSLQAKAFTTGKHIFFKRSEYNPESKSGQELIAHELTHVVQQNGSAVQCKSENTIVQKDTQKTSRGTGTFSKLKGLFQKDRKPKGFGGADGFGKPSSADVKLLLPMLKSSSVLKSKEFSEVQISDFVDFQQEGLTVIIKDPAFFKLMSWFCEKEVSTENINGLLLIGETMEGYIEQVLAVTERLCPRISNYQHQAYLPRASYYYGSVPENTNLQSHTTRPMIDNYTVAHNEMYDASGQRKPSSEWNVGLLMEKNKALVSNLKSAKLEINYLLKDTLSRFVRNPALVEAIALMRSLEMIPGGAAKARILGGYNEGGEIETRSRR